MKTQLQLVQLLLIVKMDTGGDTNSDGVIDSLDIYKVLSMSLYGFNEDERCLADINADTDVNVLDITGVVNNTLNVSSEEEMADIF